MSGWNEEMFSDIMCGHRVPIKLDIRPAMIHGNECQGPIRYQWDKIYTWSKRGRGRPKETFREITGKYLYP